MHRPFIVLVESGFKRMSSNYVALVKDNLPFFVRYLLIGIINTIVGFGTIFLLMYIGVNPYVSNICGYALGITVSYLLNKRFNFRSKRTHKVAYPRFLLSVLTAYCVNFGVLFVTYSVLGINKYISQIISGSFYVGIAFLGSRYIAFSDTLQSKASLSYK